MTNEIQQFIAMIADGQHLDSEQSAHAFQIMMNGGATPAQMAAFIMGLRMKGEAVSELTGAARAMRAKALAFTAPAGAIDTCGTGGDAKAESGSSYNISTAVALVAASCGVKVVKHGNRAVSSKSGSADVLEALGVNLNASLETMQQALEEANIGFLMAPNYHKAMRHIAPVRRELKLRTIFNLLGPLSNPARVTRQLLGVYDKALLRPLAEVLLELGAEHAWVVHGDDGMDELSLTTHSHVAEVNDGEIREFTIAPEDIGLTRCEAEELTGGTAPENATAMRYMLGGAHGAYRDIVILNSAAALLVGGQVESLEEGADNVRSQLNDGLPLQTLNRLVDITNREMDDDA